MKPRHVFLLCALLAAAMTAEPAAAATPTFSGCGKFAKDNASDATDPVADPAPSEVEIEAGWVDAGGPAPSINLQIANLTGSVPPPATSIVYDATYSFASGTTHFVRAHLDFAGMVAYEYGHTEPLAGQSTRYAYDGPINGEMFTGEHGVVRMELPPEAGGKPGAVIKTVVGETQLGRTTVVPSAVSQSPSRGLSFQDDNVSIGTATIGDCAAAPPASGEEPPPAAPAAPAPSSQSEPLPVRLATKKVRRAGKGKRIKLKLKSAEPLTQVAVRLSKGTRVFATGKRGKLGKSGKVKLRLKRALKKGTYALDVAATDAEGRRRVGSLKLKVR